jgi:hypothetical protein
LYRRVCMTVPTESEPATTFEKTQACGALRHGQRVYLD